MFASCLHGDLGFEKYFLDFGECLLSKYKELEGKPIRHSDAEFHKDSEKNGSNGLNRMRLTDNTQGASCATYLVSQREGSWFWRAAGLEYSSP